MMRRRLFGLFSLAVFLSLGLLVGCGGYGHTSAYYSTGYNHAGAHHPYTATSGDTSSPTLYRPLVEGPSELSGLS